MTTAFSVCIVDDAVDYRFLVQHLFKHYFPNYQASFFPDGGDFLKKLPRFNPPPDLILLDHHMPGVDGYQTLLRLKLHPTYRKIPVVMMSAEATGLEIDDCYNGGVNSFLRKPIGFDLLREQMAVVCQYWLEMNKKPLE